MFRINNSVTMLLLIVILFSCGSAFATRGGGVNSVRQSKLFGIPVPLPATITPCFSNISGAGMCLSSDVCIRNGGSNIGSCLGGLAVCCQLNMNCGGTVTRNGTYITPVGSALKTCRLTVISQESDICQTRFNFAELSLKDPDANGNCVEEYLEIVGANNRIPRICGENKGQHVYAHHGVNNTTLTVSIGGLSPSISADKMRLLVMFVPCGSSSRAPEGCLQYFTGSYVPSIRSFNWKPGRLGRHLANQDYSICFRREDSQCGVCFRQCSESTVSGSFSIEGKPQQHLNSRTKFPISQLNPCMFDYVNIPCGRQKGLSSNTCGADRYCGDVLSTDTTLTMPGLPRTVCTYQQPFMIRFKTDGQEMTPNQEAPMGLVPDTLSAGFCLQAVQDGCSS